MAEEAVQSEARPVTLGPGHWLAFACYGLGMVLGLWQHGHPLLTITLMSIAVPMAAVAYIPERILDSFNRAAAQHLTAFAGLFWLVYRLDQRTPLDLALMEALAVIGASFAFSRRPKRHGYLLLISVLLAGYGSVIPPRGIYVAVFLPFLATVMLFLYASRIASLAPSAAAGPGMAPRRSWPVIAAHGGLVFGLAAAAYSFYPAPKAGNLGVVPVSYETSTQATTAPRVHRWLSGKGKRPDPAATQAFDSPEGAPDSESTVKRAGDGGNTAMDGSGGGTPSNELIMRVSSPLKLYWLGRVYDLYDGRVWRTSRQLTSPRQHRYAASGHAAYTRPVVQRVTIETWISRSLFGAYRVLNAYTANGPSAWRPEVTPAGLRLLADDALPATPFSYLVGSQLNPGETDPLQPQHYLRLPRAKITQRVRELATTITAGKEEPMARALALRDYLRNTFPYRQDSAPIPPDCETVDHFLFELKEGHCAYFAAAMTVLARLSGLPARVATGFSPGNYNALTETFDVHAYHAHAWCQIFIKDYGWLTFDATPPGAVRSRTVPLAIGGLRDPFSDEWRAVPPELTASARQYRLPMSVKQASAGFNSAGADGRLPWWVKVALAIPSNRQELEQKIKNWRETRESSARPADAQWNAPARYLAVVTNNLRVMRDRFTGGLRWVADHCRAWHVIGGIVFAVMTLVALLIGPGVLRAGRRRQRLQRCGEWFEAAGAAQQHHPDACVKTCYRLLRELLSVAGWPRKNSLDLFDYGAQLKHIDQDLCRDVLAVFFLYSRLEYSTAGAGSDEARVAFERTTRARQFLLEHLSRQTHAGQAAGPRAGVG